MSYLVDLDFYFRCMVEDMIVPFNRDNVNPASIDLTLDKVVKVHDGEGFFEMVLPDEGMRFEAGKPVFVSSVETVKLNAVESALVVLKSSMLRNGVNTSGAGWVDPAYEGTITSCLYGFMPFKLVPYQRFCQLIVLKGDKVPLVPYQGKYQGSRGVTLSVEG